jgi:NADH-quinone oxidoreductase subunit M
MTVGTILLQLVIWLPLLGAVVIAFFGNDDAPRSVWRLAVGFTAVTFVLALLLLIPFDVSNAGRYQFEVNLAWLPPIGSNFRLAVDGLSLPLVLLNALLMLSAMIGSYRITTRPRLYFSLFLILETAVAGVFTSVDLFLFFLFWELELIPMFFIIGIWGGPRREYSAFKFILFTVAGSAFMLVGILLLSYFGPHTFGIPEIAAFDYSRYGSGLTSLAGIAFILLFIGFAVKLPVFPLHVWLPDAHVEAPTAGSVILAGVLLKMGGYGMLRLCVSLLPEGAFDWQGLLIALAVINSIYGAFVALAQTDLKKMIANSSISHMGYVLLGIAALTQVGFQGALLVMMAHGLYSGLLFTMVGVVYERTHTREVGEMGGLMARMPFAGVFFFFAGLASLGLPGLAGFVAEFTTFIGSYSVVPLATILCVCTIAITAGYILWRLGTVFYGPLVERWVLLDDAIGREKLAVGLLAIATLILGVLPNTIGLLSAGGVAPIAEAVARVGSVR